MHDESIDLKIVPTVANNGVTSIINTTDWVTEAGLAKSTAIGEWRGKFQGYWVEIPYILCTAQNTTLTFQQLVNGAWAAMHVNDLPVGYTASHAIVASATAYEGISFQINGEINVFNTNGATGPTVLDFGRISLRLRPPGRW